MKPKSFYQKKSAHLLFSVLTISILSISFALPKIKAQSPRQLSLADILIGLKSSRATLPDRNKILSEAVVERGITFSLTTEIENELSKTGADKNLVEAIRQKSPLIKPLTIPDVQPPQPKPSPVIVSTLPDFTFYQKRADENMGKSEYDLAIVDYNKALELNPKSVPAYFNRGRAFYFKRDFPSAIESYSKVIEITPKDSVVYYNRGLLYEKTGNPAKAAEDYRKAVELDEKNQPAIENLKKIREAEQAKKQLPSAPTQTETPRTIQPNDLPTVLNYGRIDASLAIKMILPVYSMTAKNMNAEGQVIVEVEIDEQGNVTSAKAVSGHSLLRKFAEDAALKTKFKSASVDNKAVKAKGQIVYNFKR